MHIISLPQERIESLESSVAAFESVRIEGNTTPQYQDLYSAFYRVIDDCLAIVQGSIAKEELMKMISESRLSYDEQSHSEVFTIDQNLWILLCRAWRLLENKGKVTP